jgi:hypothetical protein
VVAGQVTRLFLVSSPPPFVVGATKVSPVLQFQPADAFDNISTAYKGTVTATVTDGPAGGHFLKTVTAKGRNGLVTFKNLALSDAGSYTLHFADLAVPTFSTSVDVGVTVTKGTTTVAAPKVASHYAAGNVIHLKATFKSNAPLTIPFTGTATILGPGNAVLGTGTLNANGTVAIDISGLAAGNYACTLSYPGDGNHTSVSVGGFTLHVA